MGGEIAASLVSEVHFHVILVVIMVAMFQVQSQVANGRYHDRNMGAKYS